MCAGCNVFELWAALLIGAMAGPVFLGINSNKLTTRRIFGQKLLSNYYTRLQKFNHTTYHFDSSSVIRHFIKKCHCYDPHNHPQLWGVLTVKFFEKIIFGGANETAKICRP